ncbi:MAG: hypothetical protein ABUR63_09255 [Verrucomicrobiota bacterium]
MVPAACAGSVDSSGASPGWSDAGTFPGSGGFFGGTGGASASGGAGVGLGGAGVDPLPPERELESSFEVPVATGRYVWVANPLSGRVAFIDATTLKVRTVEAGNAPTYLAPVPGAADAVIVLNVLSHDATLLRAEGAGGQLTSAMIGGVTPLANAWAISPDGKFALAWTDARRALASAPKTGAIGTLEGFQDVTAIDLGAQPPKATTVAVGYRPVSVTFSADGRRAFAVTQDGVSVIGLPVAAGAAGPGGAVGVIRDIPLTSVATENADTRDVSVTADGRAIVRREGSPDIRIVDLTSGTTEIVTLSGPVTDLDVTADGTRAVAVVRLTAEVAIIPLAAVGGAGAAIGTVLHTFLSGRLVGSVTLTPDGKKAVLYSNATDSEELIVLDLASAATVVQRVHAPVLSLFPSPDGLFAVVLHHQPTTPTDAGTAAPPSTANADGGVATDGGGGQGPPPPTTPRTPPIAAAFSVVPLDGTRSGRIQETAAVPQAIALAPNSSQAIVTVRDDRAKIFGAYVVGMPSLQVARLDLASPPIATGVVAAANRGYVAQVHPEGRITFIPFASGVPQTITGFDLGARVVDGVTP